MTRSEAEPERGCSCKVGSVAAEFGLAGIHDDLQHEWGDDDGPSVRELTDRFNEQLIEAAFRAGGTLPIDGEVANIYRVLHGDDADSADRTRARERLRQAGIAVETVEASLVSHQTIYRHLTDCLDTVHEPAEKSTDERIDEWRTRLLALQHRTEDVTKQGVDQLRAHDAIDIGSVAITTEVTVSCEDCGAFYTIEELLDARTCDCVTA